MELGGTIFRLPDSTIKLIAAGEVITSPCNIIKELLENSLDAGATNIRILYDTENMKRIEIIDNGCGIPRADALLLCRRHATSKLASANDLNRISTFGFRGEALASICEMANVEVSSFCQKHDTQGWTACYERGELAEPPCDKFLQQVGTHISLSKIFFADKRRKFSIKTHMREHKRSITDLVTRYAIHHREKVTISLKDVSSTKTEDLVCLLAPTSIKACFGMFFGVEMENNLVETVVESEENFKAKIQIYMSHKKSTGSNSLNQMNLILFVNNRLVEYQAMKKDVEAISWAFLNQKQHSILHYIALEVPANDVDVNTHPAKATVTLHYSEEIISFVVDALRDKLDTNLSQQTISSRSSLVIFPNKASSNLDSRSQSKSSQSQLSNQAQYNQQLLGESPIRQQLALPSTVPKRPHDLVHNDFQQRSLKQFITADKLIVSETFKNNMGLESDSRPGSPLAIPPDRPKRDLKLNSIRELRKLVANEKTDDAALTIKNSVFVGIFDHDHALIQHEKKLYSINLKSYLKELCYQFYLFDFANFPPIEILAPGNRINFVINTYLEDIEKYEKQYFDGLTYKTSKSVIDELLQHSEMFEDYLELRLTETEILTIPCIIPNEIPNLVYLGKFLTNLANHVEYSEEQECFRQIGRVLADFYSQPPANLKDAHVHRRYHEIIETKLYVAIKNYLLIPDWLFSKENICQISDTRDLYKVFERC